VPSDQTRPLEVKLDYAVSISRATALEVLKLSTNLQSLLIFVSR